jgi:hypothetical protein
VGDVGGKGIDQHHDAGRHDGQQSNDVHGAQDVEDNIARAGQAFAGERHVVVVANCVLRITDLVELGM